MLAGDFNSKIRRKTGPESYIGQWSRGRRNKNGTNLVEFCDKNGNMLLTPCIAHYNVVVKKN